MRTIAEIQQTIHDAELLNLFHPVALQLLNELAEHIADIEYRMLCKAGRRRQSDLDEEYERMRARHSPEVLKRLGYPKRAE